MAAPGARVTSSNSGNFATLSHASQLKVKLLVLPYFPFPEEQKCGIFKTGARHGRHTFWSMRRE
jgi:hypothetical protein